jgi:hypothetical protein
LRARTVLEHIARSDVATTNFAKNTGTTTAEVKALEGAFQNLGGSADDAQGAISAINKIMLDLKNKGFSDAITPLARAGFLDVTAFAKAKDYTDRLLMLSDALRKMPRTDAQYWLKDAGFSEGTGNTLLAGRDALLQQIALQKQLNALSEDDKRAAVERTQASNNLRASFEGLARKIATELTPVWVAFQEALTAGMTWLQSHMTVLVNLVGGMGAAFLLLKGYKIELWARAVGGGLGAIGSAAATLIGRLGGVLAVMTAIYDIYKLGRAFWDWYVFGQREGVRLLTPDEQAARAASEPAGGGSGGGGEGLNNAGLRNNNPGNIEFAGQSGATRSGRWARFSSMVEGYAAMDTQLTRYLAGGTNTIAKIVAKYAPAKDGNNVAAYTADLTNRMGKGANEPLDAASMGSLMAAMASHEIGGKNVNMHDLVAGMAMANSRGTGAGTTVHVDNVTINTPSSDPKAHADAFAGRLGSLRLATQSSTGMF